MATYKGAGVDIDAGDRAVELMKASIARASRPEVMGGIGGQRYETTASCNFHRWRWYQD